MKNVSYDKDRVDDVLAVFSDYKLLHEMFGDEEYMEVMNLCKRVMARMVKGEI